MDPWVAMYAFPKGTAITATMSTIRAIADILDIPNSLNVRLRMIII